MLWGLSFEGIGCTKYSICTVFPECAPAVLFMVRPKYKVEYDRRSAGWSAEQKPKFTSALH